MMQITLAETSLSFKESDLHFSLIRKGCLWEWEEGYTPDFTVDGSSVPFLSAADITHRRMETGLGEGILSHYEGFTINGRPSDLAFETYVWIEAVTGHVYFEWIPVCEDGVSLEAVRWPGPMAFQSPSEDWYTLLNIQQGLLIPNTWPEALGSLPFDGRLCSAGNYMPWFSQIRNRHGYLAVCEQPWDSSFYAVHPAGGPYTTVGIQWGPSLGKMDYRRSMRFTFLSDCDYNDICKEYRVYAKEKGLFCSLAEKAAKNPLVNRLIGSSFVHEGIKNYVSPDSSFYDPKLPDKYNRVIPFASRAAEFRHYRELGFEKLYLHLDGWAEPGYDNGHPDYGPACEEAGGWKEMKELADTLHDCGYLWGIHDQYRDYYFRAKTFDREFGCLQADGTLPEHSRWAGGRQTYLCATQAPFYVKRNFSQIKAHGIRLDAAYLDVFTCNEGDECGNPRHRMTREECFKFRSQCFEYLLSQGILPSSEEVCDWSMKSLVFCHYAPYHFMMSEPGTPQKGVPVPLFSLVYHDCVIEPWPMEKVEENCDYMLLALLNGGAPYLIRDSAYPNIDGAFEPKFKFTLEEAYSRCQTVAELHKKVAKEEMVSHKFLDGDYSRQETVFADGTTVWADLKAQTYKIKLGAEQTDGGV